MKTFKELVDLSGRAALVTGGNGPIGRAMVETLAELGAATIVLDRDEASASEFAAHIATRHGTESIGVRVDLASDSEIARIPGIVEQFSGSLDILINNAAMVGTSKLEGWVAPFEQQSVETWRRALDVNLTAAFAVTQQCAAQLRASGRGSVINTASIYGILGPDMSLYEGTPMGNPAAYAASKGGLIQLTRWLSTTLAPQIRVNAISPGGIERGQPEVFQLRYVARTPLKRMGREEDIKGATAFLASDLSAYVTGQNLVVDGGWSAW